MIGKNRDQNQGNLFSTPLRNLLNPRHELYQLADAIDWKKLEDRFAPLYSHTGRPSAPIRLMVSLLLLKQIDNLGDETVVAKWVENPYYQYFSGMDVFQWKPPIDPTDLVKFRQRIGQEGVELIFKASVDLHGDLASEDEIVADTTVQEKAIRYPTDARLYSRVIEHCRRINLREGGLQCRGIGGLLFGICNRGYRGRKQINNTRILTPTTPRGSDTPYHKRKMRQQFRLRTAIEPRIGHLKSRFRFNRNWLKGAFGDRMNLFLSAAAWNIKKWMNSVARASFNRIWGWVIRLVEPVVLIPTVPWPIMVPRSH